MLRVCVYYCSTYYKAVRVGGGDSGGHVLRETTSRGLSVLRLVSGCPSHTGLLFITAVPNTKLCAWGEEDSGGHVL